MEKRKESKDLVRAISVAIALLILVAAYSFLILYPTQKTTKGNGDYISDSSTGEALIGGDFLLTDQDGNKFSSESLKGSYSMIYFGFTYCPDICPTALEIIANTLGDLAKYNTSVNAVFITIDPERDNAPLLKKFLGHFHPKIIGLTGTPEEIKDVAHKFKVYYALDHSEKSDKSSDYMINHSSFIYLMDENGKYLKHFSLNSTSKEISNYIMGLK
jgi:protein SCO1/2